MIGLTTVADGIRSIPTDDDDSGLRADVVLGQEKQNPEPLPRQS